MKCRAQFSTTATTIIFALSFSTLRANAVDTELTVTSQNGMQSAARGNATSTKPDERVIRKMTQGTNVSEKDVRANYDACDAGFSWSMAICASYHFTADDLRMNDVYQQVLKNLKGTSAEAKIRKAQRAWIAYRDASCLFESESGDHLGEIMLSLSCKDQFTLERLSHLEEYARCTSPGCPGEW